MEKEIKARKLAMYLHECFSDWVGTPNEHLLEDVEIVKDHLVEFMVDYVVDSSLYTSSDIRKNLNSLTPQVWEMAWDIFDQRNKNNIS